jgi:hypothetical protein
MGWQRTLAVRHHERQRWHVRRNEVLPAPSRRAVSAARYAGAPTGRVCSPGCSRRGRNGPVGAARWTIGSLTGVTAVGRSGPLAVPLCVVHRGPWRNWQRTCFASRGLRVRVPLAPLLVNATSDCPVRAPAQTGAAAKWCSSKVRQPGLHILEERPLRRASHGPGLHGSGPARASTSGSAAFAVA